MGYKRNAPWTHGTVGHWLFNERGSLGSDNPVGHGTADVLGNHHLVAYGPDASPLDEPGYITSPFGPARTCPLGGDLTGGGFVVKTVGEIHLPGAMSAMILWRNNGQTQTHDPVIFGEAASNVDNTFTFCYNSDGFTANRFTWFNNGADLGFQSQIAVGDNDTDWYRIFITRSNAGNGGRHRMYIRRMNYGMPLVLDTDMTGTHNNNGTAAKFSIGFSLWNGLAGSQGCAMGVAEMRLWDRELSDREIRTYDADPYYEFYSLVLTAGQQTLVFPVLQPRIVKPDHFNPGIVTGALL